MAVVPSEKVASTPPVCSSSRSMVVPKVYVTSLAGRVEQDLGQVAPHDLDVPVGHAGEQLRGVDRDVGAAGPDQGHRVGGGPRGLGLRQQPHPGDDLDGGPEQVDRLAAVADPQLGGALHDGDLVPVAVQPVGQDGPGDAGAGDEHVHGSPKVRLLTDR